MDLNRVIMSYVVADGSYNLQSLCVWLLFQLVLCVHIYVYSELVTVRVPTLSDFFGIQADLTWSAWLETRAEPDSLQAMFSPARPWCRNRPWDFNYKIQFCVFDVEAVKACICIRRHCSVFPTARPVSGFGLFGQTRDTIFFLVHACLYIIL